MKSVLDVEVSCFRSYKGKEAKPVNLLTWLKSEKYADKIQELRKEEDKAKRDKIKATLPAITVSGIFHPTRKEENLIKHSKLICIDIDPKGNEHIQNFQDLKEELFKIKNVAYAGLSASGKGFFLIIPIAYPKRHKQHFKSIYNKFQMLFNLTIDKAPQNVASLRGYSCDHSALFRHDAIPYRNWASPRKQKNGNSRRFYSFPAHSMSTKEKVEAIIDHIVTNRIDITAYEPDWFRIACALASEFGGVGSQYFHKISKFHSAYDYDETEIKYLKALNNKYTSIKINTFYHIYNKFLRKALP